MKHHAIKWLWSVPGKKKIYVLFLVAIQSLLGVSGVLFALFFKDIVDAAEKGNGDLFVKGAICAGCVIAAQIALRALLRFLNEYTKASLENIFKSWLFERITKKDQASVAAIHSGEWMTRLTNDTTVIANNYAEILPGVAGMFIKLVSALIAMFTLDYKLALIVLPFGALLFAATYSFRKISKRLHKDIQSKNAKLRVFLLERLNSLEIVKSFAAEDETLAGASERMEDHKAARMKRNRFSNLSSVGFGIALNGMYLFAIIYCGVGILNREVSFGTLTAVTQLINQIQSPFSNISGYLPRFYAMTASAERLMDINNLPDEYKGAKKTLSEVNGYYENELDSFGMKGVSFAYYPVTENVGDISKENMPKVLDNASVEIKRGEYVALLGTSGGGKSTMLKLLMCVYTPDSGTRFLRDKNGAEIPLDAAWHRMFAYVPQGNRLMTGTIRDVVSFADPSASGDGERIRNALKIACAENFVNELEKGIDTLLGEHGNGLSEGQMQRIAIARAVFSESPVILLDEATSALDEKTESDLLNNIKKLTDKTVVIITHRKAALEVCDKVYNVTKEGAAEQV
ncbi:MAG: ABC transporter ATP-binding protein [Clostridia bacterium]|nr:ABC transporter ATP-binding protein [Clostridia bacterium]